MNSIKSKARTAGTLYLLYMATTIAAEVLGRSKLIDFNNAALTARNIMAHEWQLRAGIAGDLVSAVLFLLAAWALYALLKPVNEGLALLFFGLNLAGTAVYSINLLNQIAAVLLLSGADYLKVFQSERLESLAMFFLTLHRNGFWIAQIFFGAWLFPLGYTVFKSKFLPKILGVILMIHCGFWILTVVQFFLFPSFQAITKISFPLGLISELALTLWLLIMGAKETGGGLGQCNQL